MFDKQDVINKFKSRFIEEDMLILDEKKGIGIDLDAFVNLFGDVELKKEALKAHEKATKQWERHFDSLFN